jgi:uncharacterized protein YbjT (DUF2867 family)
MLTNSRFQLSLGVLTFLAFISSTLSFTTKPKTTKIYGSERMILKASAVSPGDKVLVIGGTGGVGQLTVGKLQSNGFGVRTTSRDKKKGEEVIADNRVEVMELDLLVEDTSSLETAMDGVQGVVISIGTTAFPTARWKGGNTPKAIDEDAVKRIADVAAKVETMKKIVMVTSVGVERTGEMPFLILNLFGVLDAKKSGEQAVAAAAAQGGFDYVVVRPGRLVGGPFTNLDVAKLLQVEGEYPDLGFAQASLSSYPPFSYEN